jgi:hypothetical protein
LASVGTASTDTVSEVIGLKESSNRQTGVVYVRSTGTDAAGQAVLLGVAEIGDRVERDVRHGLAEHDVEDQQVVEGGSGSRR